MPKSPSRKITRKKVQKSKANRKSVSMSKSKSNKSVKRRSAVNRKKVIRMRFDDNVGQQILRNAEMYQIDREAILKKLKDNTPESIGRIPIPLFPEYVQNDLRAASTTKEQQEIAYNILNPIFDRTRDYRTSMFQNRTPAQRKSLEDALKRRRSTFRQ
jgi:hypothetical protein